MKVSKNVGTVDRLLRLSLGYSLLGFGIARKSDLLMILGSIKVAEGITRFCVLYHVLGVNTLNDNLDTINRKITGIEVE